MHLIFSEYIKSLCHRLDVEEERTSAHREKKSEKIVRKRERKRERDVSVSMAACAERQTFS